MSKLVPAPTVGRVVLFMPLPFQHRTATEPFPAHIVSVEVPEPAPGHEREKLPASGYRVNLAVLSPEPTRVQVLFRVQGVSYGEGKPGCWWWPARSGEDMIVED